MRNGNSTYNFDQIGNRVDAAVPAALSSPAGTFDYISNSLNQYTSITDLPSPISDLPTHDLDGNLLDDGKGTTFTWNAENRMITATKGNTLVENTYDSQGRRVRKKVNVSGVTQKDLRFFYDGWNLLYELDTESVDLTRYYVWGLDLSQSMQGAGGVGGLLFTTTTTAAHAISYDANGNISEYIDLSDGSIDAHLEYDAFGRIIASTGTAPSNFGFSTKYQDTETGFLYYGFRYYDPETGRWPNRDPIGELGFELIRGNLAKEIIVELLMELKNIQLLRAALKEYFGEQFDKIKTEINNEILIYKSKGFFKDDEFSGNIRQKLYIFVGNSPIDYFDYLGMDTKKPFKPPNHKNKSKKDYENLKKETEESINPFKRLIDRMKKLMGGANKALGVDDPCEIDDEEEEEYDPFEDLE